MRVNGARREDELLARDDLGVDADDHAVGDALHDIRVAALADADDVALLEPDVGLRASERVRAPASALSPTARGTRRVQEDDERTL